MFSLDFSMLWQDLGKFQKHRWLHASQCLHSRQTSIRQSFLEPLVFAYVFHHFKKYFISVSQTQIGENADNLNHAESYNLTGNYRQLTMLVRTEASRNILTK